MLLNIEGHVQLQHTWVPGTSCSSCDVQIIGEGKERKTRFFCVFYYVKDICTSNINPK